MKTYVCRHKGNLDACGNERCWDLLECQDTRYNKTIWLTEKKPKKRAAARGAAAAATNHNT